MKRDSLEERRKVSEAERKVLPTVLVQWNSDIRKPKRFPIAEVDQKENLVSILTVKFWCSGTHTGTYSVART